MKTTNSLPESTGTPDPAQNENPPIKKKAPIANQGIGAARLQTKSAHKITRKTTLARPGSKTAKLLDLLKRPGGATLKELMKAAGWQPHSMRGFLSGTVSKKMGLRLESFKRDDQHAYRIITK
jgi:Protein of unknown function (DUF3489)